MYAYYFLSDEKSQLLYEEIRKGILACNVRIPSEFPPEQINTIIKAVLIDHPELFWYEGKWQYQTIDGKRYVVPQYLFSKLEIAEAQKKILDCVKELEYLRGKNTYSKIKMVYEWMLSHVAYGITDTKGQNIYDALVKKKAVCKGLSKAYQYLLNELGIFSTLAEGTLDGVVKHIWNVVEIDKCYYNVDVSMGYEQFSYLFNENLKPDKYRCFVVSDAQLGKTHERVESDIPHLLCEKEYQEV